jgi:hypothetical protein
MSVSDATGLSGAKPTREDPARKMSTEKITCGGCDRTWTGLSRAHCSKCDETFNSVKLFDAHRRGFSCRPPAALGYEEVDGVWRDRTRAAQVRAVFAAGNVTA